MIATEASNLLPLFYRSLSLSSLLTLDSCFRSVAATRWHVCCISYHNLASLKLLYASLRIGLGCLHSPRCRIPARISGKDFPLTRVPAVTNLCFFFRPFLSALHASRSHGHHPLFPPSNFRLPLGLPPLRTLPGKYFVGNPQKPDQN